MKKILAIFLAITLLGSLVACGKGEPNPTDNTTDSTTDNTTDNTQGSDVQGSSTPYAFRTFFQVEVIEPVRGADGAFHIPEDPSAQTKYLDNCVLYLPASYTVDGAPTKLVVYCKHGNSEIQETSDPVLTEKEDVTKLMLKQGYAILACNGIPEKWREDLGLCARVVGNPIGPQSVEKAYDYVMKNYNLDSDGVFLYGYSQGGHYALNVAEYANIPIKAVAVKSPAVSYQFHQWDVKAPVKGFIKSARLNVARIFGFPEFSTNDELETLEFNPEYVKGYDPLTNNTTNPYGDFVYASGVWKLPEGTTLDDITSTTTVKKPIKIWCGTQDTSLGCDVMQVLAKSIRNAGGTADIRVFNNGDHSLTKLAVIGTTTLSYINSSGETEEYKINIRPQDYEILQFMEAYGGYPAYVLEELSGQDAKTATTHVMSLVTNSTYGVDATNSKYGTIVSQTNKTRMRTTDMVLVEPNQKVTITLKKDLTDIGLAASLAWWEITNPSNSTLISTSTETTAHIQGTAAALSDTSYTDFFKYQLKKGDSIVFTNTTNQTQFLSMAFCSLTSPTTALDVSDYTIVYTVD